MKTGSKILSALVIVVAVGFLVFWYQNKENALSVQKENTQTAQIPDSQPQPQTATKTKETAVATTTANAKTYSYKNGTYSTKTSYMAPSGQENFGFSLTVQNDKVTDVTITNLASDRVSSNYQNIFSAGIKTLAIGQSLNSLKVGVVSGASLTSNAFNLALVNIKAQAKAN